MYQKILVCCLLSLILVACKKEESVVVVNVDDDFTIDMFEDISNGEQRFQLNIQTIKELACQNFQIEYDLDFDEQSNNIDLSINDLIEPENCTEGNATASLVVPFGQLSNGTYSFDLSLKDAIVNQGRLVVSEDHYLLELDTEDGVELVHERLNRIPQNTIWGYVAYNTSAAASDAESFINDLQELEIVFETEEGTHAKGFYGYFQIEDDHKITLTNEISENHFIPFLYRHESVDMAEIRAVIDNACINTNLEIHVFGENGLEMTCE